MPQDVEGRHRLRLSITPELNQILEDNAKALGINPTSLATVALALGLRVFQPMINPMGVPGMSELIDANSAAQAQAVVDEVDLQVR